MYARASTGGSFGNAARYNEEGLSEKQKEQKLGNVEFLGSSNLLSDDAKGIAAEMAAVASRSRSEKPVWNVSLSVEPGQKLTDDQWRKAVDIYMKEMGADPARHQFAIWRHSDTGHDHVHALINAVPVDSGPALLRYHNNKKAVGVAVKIDQALGLTPPKQRTSLRSHSRQTQQARERVATALKDVLSTRKPTSFDELKADLQQLGIATTVRLDSKGISFKSVDSVPVKGSAVGFKFAQVTTILEANRAEYIAEIERLRQDKANAEREIDELTKTPKIIETVVDRVVADQTRIAELEQQKERLRQRSQAEIERLKSELSDAYDKRDAIRDAFHNQAREKEQLQQDKSHAEATLNSLKNQPPQTVVRAVEIVKPSLADREKIKQLEKENAELTEKLQAAAAMQIRVKAYKHVDITPAQATRLVDGKPLTLSSIGRILMLNEQGRLTSSPVAARIPVPSAARPAETSSKPTTATDVQKPAVSTPVTQKVAQIEEKQPPKASPAPDPPHFSIFRKKLHTHQDAIHSPVLLQKRLRNPVYAKPHLNTAFVNGEVHFSDGTNTAKASALGFDKKMGWSERDLLKLPQTLDMSPKQGPKIR